MATSEACDAHCSLSVDSAAAGRHFLVSVCLCLVPAPRITDPLGFPFLETSVSRSQLSGTQRAAA